MMRHDQTPSHIHRDRCLPCFSYSHYAILSKHLKDILKLFKATILCSGGLLVNIRSLQLWLLHRMEQCWKPSSSDWAWSKVRCSVASGWKRRNFTAWQAHQAPGRRMSLASLGTVCWYMLVHGGTLWLEVCVENELKSNYLARWIQSR
jgi:hypothetical protein